MSNLLSYITEVNWKNKKKGTVLLEQGDARSDAPYRPRLSVHVPGGTSEKGCIIVF